MPAGRCEPLPASAGYGRAPPRRGRGKYRGQVTAVTTHLLQGGRVSRSLAEESFVSRCTFRPAPRGKEEKDGGKKSLPLIIAVNHDNGNGSFWSIRVPCSSHAFALVPSETSGWKFSQPTSPLPPLLGERAGGLLCPSAYMSSLLICGIIYR